MDLPLTYCTRPYYYACNLYFQEERSGYDRETSSDVASVNIGTPRGPIRLHPAQKIEAYIKDTKGLL